MKRMEQHRKSLRKSQAANILKLTDLNYVPVRLHSEGSRHIMSIIPLSCATRRISRMPVGLYPHHPGSGCTV